METPDGYIRYRPYRVKPSNNLMSILRVPIGTIGCIGLNGDDQLTFQVKGQYSLAQTA